jgi:hypothetical protein
MEVARLRAMLNERNEECRTLRKGLAEATRELERRPASTSPPPRSADEAISPQVVGTVRKPLVPRVERAVEGAMAQVPMHVAAEAMRRLGSLAAGDASAWSAVKQAKDIGERIYLARVGIHHRLLLRAEDGELVATDLIPRERLELTLKAARRK